MDDHREPSPINALPPVVVLLFLAIALPELAFSLAERGLIGGADAIGWRLVALRDYSFSGDVFDWMLSNGRWMPDQVLRFLTYPFLHMSFMSSLFAAVLLLALGKMVGEVLGQVAVFVVFMGGAVFGALVYGLMLNEAWLTGAYPAVYGLIGAYTFVMWQALAGTGDQQYRAFTLIAMLLGIQLLFGALFGGTNEWVADLAGFVFGFGATVLLVPGGIARVMAALRRDS